MFIALSICLKPTTANAQTLLEDSVLEGNNFKKAAFRLWYNDNTEVIRGVLVLVPGSNGNGRNMANDTVWQNLATRHNLALLACYFRDKPGGNMAIEKYVDVKIAPPMLRMNAFLKSPPGFQIGI